MSSLFRNSSPGALTREQAVALEKKRMAARRQQARALAAQGRGGDTEVAHVTRGEMVLPRQLQSPEVLAALGRAAAAHNIPLGRLRIGNAQNRINPHTGMPEFSIFGDIGDWFSRTFGTEPAEAATPPQTPDAGGNSAVASGDDPSMEGITVKGSLLTDDPSTNIAIAGLHPAIRYDAAQFINAVKDRTGQQLRIPLKDGTRTIDYQNQLFAQGRTEPGRIVTPLRGGESYHNYGLGFDVAPLEPDGKTPNYNISLKPFAPIANEYGFDWGGNFSKPDQPHFQRTYGYTTDQLRQMMEPGAIYPTIPGQ